MLTSVGTLSNSLPKLASPDPVPENVESDELHARSSPIR